jgi:hypothetical protein
VTGARASEQRQGAYTAGNEEVLLRHPATMLISLLVLLSSGIAWAQSKEPDSDPLLARVSYDVGSSALDWKTQEGYPQACFAVYRSGYYQISRLTKDGRETLQGTLSQQRLLDFSRMLQSLDFNSSGGGTVFQGSELFIAEVVRDSEATHYFWMNPDHRNPFPSSAIRVIRWLKDFHPDGASQLAPPPELSNHSICPRVSKNGLQPLTAGIAR